MVPDPLRRGQLPLLYYSDEEPDQDFEELSGDVAEALERWRAECEQSRRVVAAAESLDQAGMLLNGD